MMSAIALTAAILTSIKLHFLKGSRRNYYYYYYYYSLCVLSEDGAVAGQVAIPLEGPEGLQTAASHNIAIRGENLFDIQLLDQLLKDDLYICT